MSPLAFSSARRVLAWGALAAVVALAGCATRSVPAPVESRPVGAASGSGGPSGAARPAGSPPAAPSSPPAASTPRAAATPVPATPPVAEPASAEPRPGYYTVRPGDILGRIALDHGQSWRDLARWNGLENPNVIEVGQQLRVVPPGVEPGAAVARPVTPSGRVETRPLEGRPVAAAPATGSSGPGSASAPTPASVPAPGSGPPAGPVAAPGAAPVNAPGGATPPNPAPATASAPTAREEEEVAWAWPSGGPVIGSFDEARQAKGLAIGGKAGDPVLAAADGRVVYAGTGLRGYGNLVIIKHNALFLSAYAHNQTLLVKEDQVVRRGQKIAEMGSSETERVQLHFEIRRQGRPVDPARLLPAR
ncbi:MAG: peptidoglycan DD-metalloendopeptidase family protein [Rubrivivax sp.]